RPGFLDPFDDVAAVEVELDIDAFGGLGVCLARPEGKRDQQGGKRAEKRETKGDHGCSLKKTRAWIARSLYAAGALLYRMTNDKRLNGIMRLAIMGAGGRMGKALVRQLHEMPNCAISGGTEPEGSP